MSQVHLSFTFPSNWCFSFLHLLTNKWFWFYPKHLRHCVVRLWVLFRPSLFWHCSLGKKERCLVIAWGGVWNIRLSIQFSLTPRGWVGENGHLVTAGWQWQWVSGNSGSLLGFWRLLLGWKGKGHLLTAPLVASMTQWEIVLVLEGNKTPPSRVEV